jgi:heme O synthase-like polyprenyltransferase
MLRWPGLKIVHLLPERVSCTSAIVFGTYPWVLSGLAFFTLYTNPLTLSIALAGFFMYVVPYSFGKYRTSYGTLIGSIAGAAPPLVGYCAVTNQLRSRSFSSISDCSPLANAPFLCDCDLSV